MMALLWVDYVDAALRSAIADWDAETRHDETVRRYSLHNPIGRLASAPKFEFEDRLFVPDLVISGYEALREGLLPIPSSQFYFEVGDVLFSNRVAAFVNFQKDTGCASIVGCIGGGEREILPWFCYLLMQGEAKVVPTMRTIASERVLDQLGGQVLEDVSNRFTDCLMVLCMALNCRDVDQVHISPSGRVKNKREARGLPPLDEYRRLTVKPYARAAYEAAADERARNGPRLHFRRGHVRTLGSGAKTYVSPAWVGNANLGTITKDYVVKA